VAIRRGVVFVLSLIIVAVLLSAAGVAALYFVASREPDVQARSTLVLDVDGLLSEIEPRGIIGEFIEPPPTVRSIVDNLRKAEVDDRIERVVLKPASAGALWGKVQEVREAVLDFKASGKPIDAFLEYGGEQEYYLASAADRVFLMPASPLDLTGLASYELFFRGALDKIGAEPDLLQIGDYKTAANTFTESTYTPAHREMAEWLNTDMYEQLIQAIADARDMSADQVRALVDQGPFLPAEAVRVGLVDDLAYADEVQGDMPPTPEGDAGQVDEDRTRRLDGDDYRGVSLESLGLNEGPKIAVIYAVGTIVRGESSLGTTGSESLGSDTLVRYIRQARLDPDIQAIVLRVDSPGGSSIASDVIWREMTLARDEKAVVASMSDVAASGGYYIAMPAHAIVAQPGTLTGSIGVVGGKFVTAGTFEKLGLNVESVSRGRFADMNSPVRPYDEAERGKMAEQIEEIYQQFITKAAEGRHMTTDAIDAVGRGRVWTGRQALERGLVDELGGLDRAIARAKQHAGIDADQEVEVVVYPPKKSLLEVLRDPLGSVDRVQALIRAAVGVPAPLRNVALPFELFRRGEPLALMPNVFVR
jgi:protease-4